MKRTWAIDTNLIVSKKNIVRQLDKGNEFFNSRIDNLLGLTKQSTFISDDSFEFVIPYFVMEEVLNQIEMAKREYIETLKKRNQKLLNKNWEKSVEDDVAKSIKQFRQKWKVLPKPSSKEVGEWMELFFHYCNSNWLTNKDAKDFIIAKEIEKNKIEEFVTNNVKDFVKSFPAITVFEYDVARTDLESLVLTKEQMEVVSEELEAANISIRYDLENYATSELSDQVITLLENKKDGSYKIDIRLIYDNTYDITYEEYMRNEDLYPNNSSVIISLEVDKNGSAIMEEVEYE